MTGFRDRLKNIRLKRKIRRSVLRRGFGQGIQGVHTTIENDTGRDLTIREVRVFTDEMECVLVPIGQPQSSVRAAPAKLTAAQREQLERGEPVAVGLLEVQLGSPVVPVNPLGFITIRPFTELRFLLPAELVGVLRGRPLGFKITLHYAAWTGDAKIFQETVRYSEKNTLKESVGLIRSGLATM
jgi:hypothetical protein